MQSLFDNFDAPVPGNIPGLMQAHALLWQAGVEDLHVHILRFACAQFHFTSFARNDVFCPPAIERSVSKRQAEYFFGRLAARRALSEIGWPRVQVGTGNYREPCWPSGAVGAITHSRLRAAACVGRTGTWRGIGIDIEAALELQTIASVEELAFCDAERMVLRATALSYPMALAIAFSTKESFYKAVFHTVRKFFGFEAIRIERIDTNERCVHFTVWQTVSLAWPAGSKGHIHYFPLDDTEVLTAFAW
jgi:4'-phosphopantetheinyl transferase EntD